MNKFSFWRFSRPMWMPRRRTPPPHGAHNTKTHKEQMTLKALGMERPRQAVIAGRVESEEP
jgi:hypothetical protein